MRGEVAAHPAVEAPPNIHASPLTFSALLTFTDFVLDDTVNHDAHGNLTLLLVKGGGDVTGTVAPEAVVNNLRLTGFRTRDLPRTKRALNRRTGKE
jgi:hypothetical protein